MEKEITGKELIDTLIDYLDKTGSDEIEASMDFRDYIVKIIATKKEE